MQSRQRSTASLAKMLGEFKLCAASSNQSAGLIPLDDESGDKYALDAVYLR